MENSYFWGLLRKIWLFKPPCKKIFFLRFAQFSLNIFFKGDLGPNLLVKFILCNGMGVYQMDFFFETVFYVKCVFSTYFSGSTTFFTFLTGQKMWKFICVKSYFLLHWIVSANFTSKYTLKTFVLSFSWSVPSVTIQFGGILCFGVGSAGQLFYTNIAKKRTNLNTNAIYVFQFCLNLHSIYLGR